MKLDDLEVNTVTMKSPYGGLIIIRAPQPGIGNIRFTMTNVVQAPRYDVSDPNRDSQWEERYH